MQHEQDAALSDQKEEKMATIYDTLKVRVRSIILTLDMVNDISTEMESKKGLASTMLSLSKETANQMRFQCPNLAKVLLDSKVEVSFEVISRILLSWLETDTLNSSTPHMAFLCLGLYMSKQWLGTKLSENKAMKAKVEQPINELLLSLAHWFVLFRDVAVPVIAMLSLLTPVEILDSDLKKLKEEEEKNSKNPGPYPYHQLQQIINRNQPDGKDEENIITMSPLDNQAAVTAQKQKMKKKK